MQTDAIENAVVASGSPEAVLTSELIYAVYGVRAEVTLHAAAGRLHVVFMAAARSAMGGSKRWQPILRRRRCDPTVAKS
jgi:hypothetical protein